MDPAALKFVGWIVGGFFVLAFFFARRQNLFHNLRYMLIAAAIGIVVFVFCESKPEIEAWAPVIAVSAAFLVYQLRPRRKRRMSAATRRRKIAKWEYETGKKYNPQKYEIDHIVPFADGGSDTEDNLRVIEKRHNRSKGASTVWWDVFGRR